MSDSSSWFSGRRFIEVGEEAAGQLQTHVQDIDSYLQHREHQRTSPLSEEEGPTGPLPDSLLPIPWEEVLRTALSSMPYLASQEEIAEYAAHCLSFRAFNERTLKALIVAALREEQGNDSPESEAHLSEDTPSEAPSSRPKDNPGPSRGAPDLSKTFYDVAKHAIIRDSELIFEGLLMIRPDRARFRKLFSHTSYIRFACWMDAPKVATLLMEKTYPAIYALLYPEERINAALDHPGTDEIERRIPRPDIIAALADPCLPASVVRGWPVIALAVIRRQSNAWREGDITLERQLVTLCREDPSTSGDSETRRGRWTRENTTI